MEPSQSYNNGQPKGQSCPGATVLAMKLRFGPVTGKSESS